MADQEEPKDERVPMSTFGAGERFKESVYTVGDVTLFRPMSLLEIFVGVPVCALLSYLAVYPIFGGQWAIAAFVVLVYFSPRLLVLAEAKAGRPVVAEAFATARFLWAWLWGANLYQGTQLLGRFSHPHQRRRLKAMLAEEDRAHAELMANRRSTSRP